MRKKRKKQKKRSLNFKKIKILTIVFSCLLIFSLLIINIISSQTISSFYLGLINYDKKSHIDFLKKIKSLSFFKDELKKSQSLFGKEIVEEVFQEEKELNIKINKLESALQKNPKARDVLYALYQLYKEKGDYQKANDYLKKTKEIDPLINN